MIIDKKIKMALAYLGISQAELAKRLNTTPQNLSQRLKRNNFNDEEMEQIAFALGCKLILAFEFPDGTKI